MKKMSFIVGMALFLAAGTQAAVLIQDGFDDGGRTDGVDALDVNWWAVYSYTLSVNTTGGLGSGNALSVVGTGNSLVLGNFANQVLSSEGDRMTFSFDIQLTSLANSNIRFGLLDSRGSLVEADVTVDDLADNDSGYYFKLDTGTNTDSKFYEDGGTSTPFGGSDIAARTGGVFGIADTNVHTVKMTYTYQSGTIKVEVVIDEGTAGQWSLSWTDTSSLKQSFNEAGILLQGGMDGLIDNIVVAYDVVANFAPTVNAGSDQVIFLGDAAALNATASDPEGQPLTLTWSATGPGTATFTPGATVEDPSVSFDLAGVYTLQLEASDGSKTGSDALTVVVRDPAEKALMALWDFETSAPAEPNVFDAVGNNDGAWTAVDPNYVDGWITGASPDLAAKFYGDKYIEIVPDNNDLNTGLQYGLTVACWLRVDNASTFQASDRIIEKGGWALSGSSNPGSVKLNLSGQPGSGINAVTSVTDGYWHHVAGVYDGHSMSIYIDGLLEATNSTIGFLPATVSNVTIGANNSGAQQLHGVAVDDVRVYNYGLDAFDIAVLAMMGDNLAPRIDTLTASATSIQLPTDTINLGATASDPDLDSLTYAWSKVAGSGAVTFSAPSSLTTNAVFVTEGAYTLRLSVDDGTAVVSKDVQVLVYPENWNGELAYMPYDNQDPNDASFWGYEATVYGNPTYSISSQTGTGAIEFNGTTDYLEYSPSLASDGVTDLTFCAWVRADTAADMDIAGNYPNYDGEEQGWRLWFEGDGYFKFWIGEKNGIADYISIPSATWVVGEWVHVTVTFKYNGTNNEVKFYWNGQLKLNATTNYRVSPTPTIPFVVGRRSTGGSYLNGAVDELYLFGRVLSQPEIAELAGLNIPPVVDAGENKKIILPTNSVFLNGTATDEDAVTVAWSVAEGEAANVSISPLDAPNTTVTITQVGDYLLRLTATDSFSASASDNVLVKVRPAGFDGLEAHIAFENADPNLAVDSTVGIGYAGTLHGDPNAGFAASDAKLGAGALELFNDAVTKTDYVSYSKFLGAEPAISVSVWFKCENLSATSRIIEKWPADSSGDGWMLRIRSEGNLAAMIGSAFGSGSDMRAPLGTLVQGEWAQAVLTFDNGVARLYQNGALVDEETDLLYSPDDIVAPMLIGRRFNNNNEWFDGLVDDVRIYDYALSVEEVKAFYAGDGGLPWNTCPAAGLAGDLTRDCRVDIQDIAELGTGWQSTYTISELLSVAQDWLECDNLDLSQCF